MHFLTSCTKIVFKPGKIKYSRRHPSIFGFVCKKQTDEKRRAVSESLNHSKPKRLFRLRRNYNTLHW